MDQETSLYVLPAHINNRLNAAIFSHRPLQQVLDFVLDLALELSRAQYGSLFWVNRRKNVLESKAIRHAPDVSPLATPSKQDFELTQPSIMAEVVKTGTPQLASDLRTEKWRNNYRPLDPAMPMASVLAVPLFSNDGNVVVGILNVASREPEAFKPADQECLRILAQHAKMVVQRATLSNALFNLSQHALTMNLDDLLAYTAEALTDLLDVSVCSIWLTDPLSDHLVLKHAIGRPIRDEKNQEIRFSKSGLLGRALNSNVPLFSPNITEEKEYRSRELRREMGWKSGLFVSIRSSTSEPMGVIAVYSVREERHFTEQDNSLAIAFSNHVAIVLQQVRLLADKERQVEVETTLKRVSEALATAEDFHGLLNPIVEATMRLLRAAGAILYLRDESAQANAVAAVAGIAELVKGMRSPLEGSLSGWVALRNEPALCNADDPLVDQRIAGRMGLQGNIAAAPLALKNRVIGTLVVLDKQGGQSSFDTADVQLLQTLATQATLAIEKARLYEDRERSAKQHRVINDILTESMSCGDIDDLFLKTARWIREAFGYKVSLCLLEHGQLVFKVSALYNGMIRRNRPIFSLGQGITGLVARTGESCVVPDVGNTLLPYHRGFQETRSELTLPLFKREGPVVGVLDMESKEVNHFSEEDLQIFRPIATGIALAIENVQHLKEHNALRTISDVVSQAQNLKQMLDNIVPTIVELFQVRACSLYLAEPDANYITLIRHQGLPPAVAQLMERLRPGQGIAGSVFKDRVPVVVRDVVNDPRVDGMVQEGDGLRSIMSVPIKFGEKILGVLEVLTATERFFTNHDVELLELIANQVGRAIEKDQFYELYRRLYQDAKDSMFTVDRNIRIRDVNHQAILMTEYTRDELLTMQLKDLIADEDQIALGNRRFHALIRGQEIPVMTFKIRRKTGSTFFVESNLTPIYDHRKELVAIEAIWRDITTRNLTAAAAEHRNRQLNTSLALSRIAGHPSEHNTLLSQVAESTMALLASERCVVHLLSEQTDDMEVLMFPRPTIAPQRGMKVSCPEHALIKRVIETKQGKIFNNIKMAAPPQFPPALGDPLRHVLMMPIKSHERILGVISVARYQDKAPPYTVSDKEYCELLANILSLDLEHKRLAEVQTKQQAALTTLEQVSMLGGFLAHKVPNVLGPIAWTAKKLASLDHSPNTEMKLLIDSLRDSGRKAERLIAQFRSLGRPLYLQSEIIPLKPLVQTALGHLTIPPSVQIYQEPLLLPPVHANPSLLTEVVEGIIQNAFDAMPDGGALYISGDTTRGMIRLHIHDTGVGISAEHLPHLFTTPFFTTKADGGRLGFNLWLSRLYLQSIGGDISVTDTSAAGTTFTLDLTATRESLTVPQPAVTDETHAQNSSTSHTAGPRPRTANVLIVEDESNWYGRLSLPFIDQGCEVHVASSYVQALQFLDHYTFAAFVVDIRLVDHDTQNIDGLKVVEEIGRRGLSGPVLILSVYEQALRQARESFESWHDVAVLDKTDDNLDAALVALITRDVLQETPQD